MSYVLDSSALLSGKDLLLDDMYCTPEVLREVRGKGPTTQLLSMIETKVEVRSPTEEAIAEISELAEKTGDSKRLSPTDVGVLALALDLGATILTDDYSIQNVANEMGLSYRGLSFPDIDKMIEWGYRCKGCGKYFDEWKKECPICGSQIRTTPKATSHISSASSDKNE
ncbi:MAG: nucleic acid-binding protein [Methanobacteriota archaeon]|nr:MAG: nucleic acid-binding protein [Euryarchaeota archaeon]